MGFWHFLRLTFCDARGVPDGKLITVMLAFGTLEVAAIVALFGGPHLPEYMWGTFTGLVLAGIGFGTAETIKKIQAEAPAPSPAVGPVTAETAIINPPVTPDEPRA